MKLNLLVPLVLSLAACGERPPEPAVVATPPAASDQPAADVPPATAPTPSTAMASMPAAGAIGFGGFGPARFGSNEEQVRMAWGADLGDARPAESGGCYQLMPQPRGTSGYRIAFMLEGGKFARIDVDATDIEAPGGGKVGMSAQEIGRRYAGRVQEQNHKYVEGGRYLRIRDPDAGAGVLLFETDAAGRVTSWRIGVPPQVDYVEGCS